MARLCSREAKRMSISTSKQLLCAVAVAVCGFSGAAEAQQKIIVRPAPIVVTLAPVIVYQPGSVTVKEVPAASHRDASSLVEDKGP